MNDSYKSNEKLEQELIEPRQKMAPETPECQEMKAALQEMEQIVSQSGIIIFLWQAKENWPVEFVSENIRTLGYTPEAFYNENVMFAQLVHPDDWERVTAEVSHYSATELDGFEQEYRIVTQAGATRWVEDHKIIRRNQDGRITHFQGLVQDITIKKEAETAIQESEARYRQMFEAHSSMQWLVDPQTQQLVDINPAAAKFYGYTREQMRQMRVPDLNILSEEEIAVRLAQAKKEERDYFMVPHRLASGEIRQIEIHAGPIKVSGRPLLYAILHDITERIQAEEELRLSNRELALLNQSQKTLNSSLDLDRVLSAVLYEIRLLLGAVACSIWLIDAGGQELVCHQATEPHSDIVRGWRMKLGQGLVGWVAQNGRSLLIPDAQTDPRHFDGVDQNTKLTTRALICVPFEVKGQVLGVLQVMDTTADTFQPSDLTLVESLASTAATAIENAQLHKQLTVYVAEMEQRVIERTRALVSANNHLKEFDRLKTKLIEDIAHEIRTPVASLSLYLDLLERGRPERHDHYKLVLREKMNELVRLTEDVLDVFRLELFQGETLFKLVDLNELVSVVVNRYRARVQAANLELVFDPMTNLPLIVVEQRQLKEVVIHLLENAINYTKEGGIQISTYWEADHDRVHLQVADTGQGIPAEELPYIFDRFYRGQNVAQFNIPGSGLGLSVVKDVVDLHAGEVRVESELGKGSLFHVWLPVGKSE